MGLVVRVNGADVEVAADPATPLLYVLRDELGLTGTRYGCGAGWCGACVVLADGVPVPACDVPVSAIEGRAIRTVEGLAGPGGLDPLQQAFLDEQAGQCGYCLSGILMAARALLDAEPAPDRARIREALDGHLCRCGTHGRMVRAVEVAAAVQSDTADRAPAEGAGRS